MGRRGYRRALHCDSRSAPGLTSDCSSVNTHEKYRPYITEFTSELRAQLDEATFEAAWAEGQAMTLEQAVAYALA
jgi:hypothetical protein